jgi:tetratricopeptide (TPR) repeat protein
MKKFIISFFFILASLASMGQNTAEDIRKNPSLAMKDAQSFFESGNYEMTISRIRIYIALIGNSDGQESLTKAQELLTKAQKCQQYIEKAKLFEGQGDDSAAIECYRNILEINPSDSNAKTKVNTISFDEIRDYYLGIACVRKGDKWGAIDMETREIIPIKYDEIWDFNPSIPEQITTPAMKNGKWGFVNKEGKEVCDFIYNGIRGIELGEPNIYFIVDKPNSPEVYVDMNGAEYPTKEEAANGILITDKTKDYYNTHKTEILPDAQSAFKNGDYNRSAELCEWYSIFVGDDKASSLRNKALQCSRLLIEMGTLSDYGLLDGARDKARDILALNPNDPAAIKVNSTPTTPLQEDKKEKIIAGSVQVTSSPTGAIIWLDENNTKKTTPIILENIMPGKHSIKLELEGYSEYSDTITITSGNRIVYAPKLMEKKTPIVEENPTPIQTDASNATNAHEWVDLGLSVKWATCNVGASIPSDYGSYFSWAETTEKSTYSLRNLRYYSNNTENTFSKYNTLSGYGLVDNKNQLDATDDAAKVNWGDGWRMPSYAEMIELVEKCIWTWTTKDGKRGYEVKSKVNGNSIFLPAAGYKDEGNLYTAGFFGYYWSASLYSYLPDYAWLMFFYSSDAYEYYDNRRYGFPIRPVTE